MNLLSKLTIKNLILNKKRSIVTIIGIMLSVALLTAVASMYTSGMKSLIKYETLVKGNFHIEFLDVPAENLDEIRQNRNIESINLTQTIGYAKINSKNKYKPYASINAFSQSSLENLSIKLIEGRLPENTDEILIPSHLKTNGHLNLNLNDTISLEVGQRVGIDGIILNQNNPYQHNQGDSEFEKLENTSSKTYKIVGIINRPNNNIESYSAPGYTFITFLDENNLSGKYDVYTRYTKDGLKENLKVTANIIGIDPNLFEKFNSEEDLSNEELEKVIEEIQKAKYTINANSYLITIENNFLFNREFRPFAITVGIVLGIIVFTSVFCIKNSFDISITEKNKQYGMLRSIGATKKQIKKNVFFEANILGLIGIPLGVLLGELAAYILIIVSNHFIGNSFAEDLKLYFSFSLIAIIAAILLGIITIYLSAFKSALSASRVSPIDSIRNSANIKINPKRLKSPKIIKRIFGIGGEISYKNLKRNKKKYRATVLSLIVSVFVFIALSSFIDIGYREVLHEIEVSDYNISLSNKNITEKEKVNFLETTKLSNIRDYTIFRSATIGIKELHYNQEYVDFLEMTFDPSVDMYVSIVALGENQYTKYVKSLGLDYDSIKDNAILVDSDYISNYSNKETRYLRKYNYHKGDIIEGTVSPGEKDIKAEIGIITDKKPFGLKNMNTGYIVISDELFDKITKSQVLTIFFDSDNPNQLQDDIEELLKNEEYSLSNITENVKTMNNLITLVGIFLYGFIIVISLIGITNIFNTITTNMELRKQEFAMLKSVGMTKKEFKRMIRLESIFMGVKSLLISIPIGLVLSYIIHHFLTSESGTPYNPPILAIIISMVAVFVLISLIMKYSMTKINKQNTIETIKNENI